MANTPATAEQHLIIVGKLEHNAASAEAIMFGAFTIVSGCSPKMARAIFYCLDSFPGKKNLLLRVAKEHSDEKEKELIDTIISSAEVTNNQRKQVAHGMLVSQSNNAPPRVSDEIKIYSPKSEPGPRYPSTEWHSDLISKSYAAGVSAKAAYEALCQKRRVRPNIEFE